MRTSFMRCAVIATTLVIPAIAFAGTPAKVKDALNSLDKWLGTDINAKNWRNHLRTADLRREVAKGDRADMAVLAQILKIYSAETAGLELKRFQNVKVALAAWRNGLASPKRNSLPKLAAALKTQYKPYPLAERTKRKTVLEKRIKELKKFLGGGSAENTQGWIGFLSLDRVEKEMAKKSPRIAVLNRSIYKFYRNESGLELKAFNNVRSALQRYKNAVYFTSLKQPQALFNGQVERLTKSVTAYVAKPNSQDAATINSTLGWLQRGGYGDRIAAGLRAHYWRPNFFGQVSVAIIKAGVEQEIKDQQKINEVILGTDIEGRVSTKGKISVRLVPDPKKATMDILFRGTAKSVNVGYNGPVTIDTTGTTSIRATKRVFVTPLGFVSDPAEATCRTTTQVNGISGSSGLVERIAWRRVESSQADAENIASRRAEARVRKQVDQRAKELVGDINQAYRDKIYLPLIRHDALPQIGLATTTEGIYLNVLQARRSQTAAATDPPPAPRGVDVGLRLHESLVANFSESVIGGWTLTDTLLADMFKEMTGKVPKELQLDQDKDPWAITFDTIQPVSVAFGDKELTIAVRGRRFVSGSKTVRDVIQISAKYKIERTKLGADFNRVGGVSVDYLRRKRLSATQAAFKAVIRRKFERFLKEKIEFTGMDLPGRWKKLGKLKLATMATRQGWLTLGWNLPAKVKNPNIRTAQRPKKK